MADNLSETITTLLSGNKPSEGKVKNPSGTHRLNVIRFWHFSQNVRCQVFDNIS